MTHRRSYFTDAIRELCLLQYDLLLVYHLTHVDQGVTHPTKGGIDGNAGQLGDFFEAHVSVVTQNDDFALLGGQGVHQFADFVVGLATDHGGLGVAFGALENVEDVEGLRLAYFRAALVAAETVYTHVVADAHCPLQELTLVVVLATTKRINDFDEYLLENVLSLAVVLRKKVNGSVYLLLVASEEFLESTVLPRKILRDQVLIVK